MLHRENRVRKYHVSSAADLLQEVIDYYEITQSDLANRLGVSQKNISDILNQKRYLNEVLALRIEKVMGISGKLLLSLDTNYRLARAKEKATQDEVGHKSALFLRKYEWVNG